jgi:hypothetical protein
MVVQILAPGVKNGKEADVSTEMPGVFCYCYKSLRNGTEEETIDELLVLESQWSEGLREGEDHVEV